MDCLVWRGLGFGFVIWAGIHLFSSVGPVDTVGALDEGDYRWIGFIFGPGGRQGEKWEGWVILFWVGCLSYRGLGIGFVIWSDIPLFCDVNPMRDLSEDDVGWFEVGFGNGRIHGGLRGVWGFLF